MSTTYARSAVSSTGEVYFAVAPPQTNANLGKLNADSTTSWIHSASFALSPLAGGVALDDAKNVYLLWNGVTKWDSDGSLLWNKPLGSGFIEIDSMRNIILEGYNSSGGYVSKFDADGELLWTTSFGDAGYEGYADPLAVDAAGNIFVTAASTRANVVTNAMLVKLSPGGDLLWRTEFGSTASEDGSGVAVDALGNVYVTGTTLGSFGAPYAGSSDVFVVKFSVPEPAVLAICLIVFMAVKKPKTSSTC